MRSNSQENNIYVTIFSNNSTNVFKNTPNTFTNLLKQPLNLNDQWVVGLSDISFSVQDLHKKNSKNKIKRSLQTSSLADSEPKKIKVNNDDTQTEIKKKFKKLLDSSLQNDEQKINLNKISVKTPDETKSLSNNDNIKLINIPQENKDNKNTSNDDKTSNTLESINDNDEPILSLTNTFLENSLNKLVDNISNYFNQIIGNEINDIICIYTDIMKPRHIGDKKTKCLKIFSISSLKTYINFNRVDYFPLETFNINDISIMIRNDEGRELKLLQSIPVYCTLHFKKI